MTKIGRDQVMMASEWIGRGVSQRTVARQLGVSEATLRYRRQRAAMDVADGRRDRRSALDGFEPAVASALEELVDRRHPERPVAARLVFDALVRDHEYAGSYPALVRYLRRLRGVPPVRALRRVETPPGVQAQHDWFVEHTIVGEVSAPVYGLLGTLSYSRAHFVWVSARMTQLAWQAGHAALFQRYGGVPRWVGIDNLKTGVSAGAGPSAVINPAFQTFARACGFQVDPCRPATGRDKGKVERRVRVWRAAAAPLFARAWPSLGALQTALDARAQALHARLRCPMTGTSVAEALAAEQATLLPLPALGEAFDCIVARRVSRDCLVSFEGRQYSVPFAWVGRDVEILGTVDAVVIRGAGGELARHPRHTAERLVLDAAHYDGPATAGVLPPAPLGRRAQQQIARHARAVPRVVARPLAEYITRLDALCRDGGR